jgi:hypothetical protein
VVESELGKASEAEGEKKAEKFRKTSKEGGKRREELNKQKNSGI